MHEKRVQRSFGAAVGAVLLTLALAAAPAQAQAGSGSFELYAGYYSPDSNILDDDVTYGVRAGYRLSDAFAVEGSVGRYEDSQDILGLAQVDFELTLVDASAVWYLNPGSSSEFFIFGGPGWAFADASADFLGVPLDSASDDTLTLHAGLGLNLGLTERVYLRPEARARWFDDSDDAVDVEASLALGFNLGR